MKKRIVGAVICAALLVLPVSAVLAAEFHEDPETAASIFSGISLFRYYSGSLDFVLQKNPAEVETRLEKMPFANVPESLKEPANDFASTVVNMSYLISTIDENINYLRVLMQQFRLDKVAGLKSEIADNISQANRQLGFIEQTVETIGESLEVSSAPAGSDLRLAYDEVMEKIDLIREMLVLYQELLESSDISLEELLKLPDISLEELLESPDFSLEELLEPTILTAEVVPAAAFVGDKVQIRGILSSRDKNLAKREIDILLNGTRYITVRTDIQGIYITTLQVPYLYIHEMEIQALYYPRDNDIGRYLASASPVIELQVMFYEASLELAVEDKAYPGLETTITGKFEYNGPSPTDKRDIEIYLDNVLIAETEVKDEFSREIKLEANISTGQHVITVSSAAAGRYSPAVASALLNVTRAVPVLDLDVPGITMIPGSIELRGRVHSELGSLSGTPIEIELGNSKVQLLSSDDGTFDTEIKAGPRWNVIGSQDLVIRVTPREPWYAPFTVRSPILQVNIMNLGIILGVCLLFGIFLPNRLKDLPGIYARKKVIPEITTAQPEPAPVYSDRVTAVTAAKESNKPPADFLGRIFYWYRLLVRFIQERTRALIRPQQTLREFALESSHVLGPTARYFTELTRIGERLLYSRHNPTQEDVEKTEKLSHRIMDESVSESRETQPDLKTGGSGEEEIKSEDV